MPHTITVIGERGANCIGFFVVNTRNMTAAILITGRRVGGHNCSLRQISESQITKYEMVRARSTNGSDVK
jgi:hypothetical protein